MAGAAEIAKLLATITARMTDPAHDLSTSIRSELGHLAGNTYARIDHTLATLDDLARTIGASLTRTARLLDRLAYAGIVEPTPA